LERIKMKIGMLWFDNDAKAALDIRIERAASYYRTKYGKMPTLCYVHPSMLLTPGGESSSPGEGEEAQRQPESAVIRHAGVEVRTHRTVLPNHFWIGVNGVNGSGD
jgi:hypothetical protein